jgi:methyl-accepting chemotaxis protein
LFISATSEFFITLSTRYRHFSAISAVFTPKKVAMSIQRKFSQILLLIGLLFLTVACWFVWQNTQNNLSKNLDQQQQQLKREILNSLALTHSLLSQEVQASMKLFRLEIKTAGDVSQGPPVQVGAEQVPELLLGTQAQANQFTLVDHHTDLMGGTATLFSKSGERFIRVSTNVQTDKGRAIGTELAPAGAAMAAIREQKPFYGHVDILGNPYITGYEPLYDKDGQVVGIAYVGYKAELAELNQLVQQSKLLEQGFVALIDKTGVVREASSHISTEQIKAAIAQPELWQLSEQTFAPWQYRLVVGINRAEVAGIVRSEVFGSSLLLLLAIGSLIGAVYWLLKKQVIVRIKQTTAAISAITSGEGDLTRRFAIYSDDEFGLMARQFDTLLDQLQQMVSQMNLITLELNHEAIELASFASHSYQATQDATQSLQAVTLAATELTEQTRHVSDNVQQASTSSTQIAKFTDTASHSLEAAMQQSQRQYEAVERSARAMEGLTEASSQIGSILEVINGIAEQTNLLALNAAIEAARAGEQGRGFAVVADEVRSLAGRTQASTSEIRTKIEQLQNGVYQVKDINAQYHDTVVESQRLTQGASQELNNVLTASQRIIQLNQQISELAHNQASLAQLMQKQTQNLQQTTDYSQQEAQNTRHASEVVKTLAQRYQQALTTYRT